MKHSKIERLFGGGRRLLTTSKRPGTGRRATPKMLLCLLVFTSIFISLYGCGATSNKNTDKAQQKADYEAQTAIKEQIENTPIPKGYATLLDDDVDNWVTVACTNGEATVSIRAFMGHTIPYTAELFFPIAQEAAEAAGVTLARFDVNSYNTNKDGIVARSWTSWQTKDGSTGTFTDKTSGETVVEPNWTIEQVYEYYADYDGIVKDMITEAGGSYE